MFAVSGPGKAQRFEPRCQSGGGLVDEMKRSKREERVEREVLYGLVSKPCGGGPCVTDVRSSDMIISTHLWMSGDARAKPR